MLIDASNVYSSQIQLSSLIIVMGVNFSVVLIWIAQCSKCINIHRFIRQDLPVFLITAAHGDEISASGLVLGHLEGFCYHCQCFACNSIFEMIDLEFKLNLFIRHANFMDMNDNYYI